MMAPSASTSSALKTLIRVTAFGLGAAYGGQRLASLQHKKKEQDDERRNREVQEAVAKALAHRDSQEELTKRPVIAHSTSGSYFPADEGEYIERWLELLDDPALVDEIFVA